MKLGKAFERDIVAGVYPPIVSLLSSYCLDMAIETGFPVRSQKHRSYENYVDQKGLSLFSKQLARRLFSAFHITMQELLCLNASVSWSPLGEFTYNPEDQLVTFRHAPERVISIDEIAGSLSVSGEKLKPHATDLEPIVMTTEMLIEVLQSRFCHVFASPSFHQAIENVAVLVDRHGDIDLNIQLSEILVRWARGPYELLSLFISEACNSVLTRNNGSVTIDDFGCFRPTEDHVLEFKASEECIDFIGCMRLRLDNNHMSSRFQAG